MSDERIRELIERIEGIGFSCEAGSLELYAEWIELKRLIAPQPTEAFSGDSVCSICSQEESVGVEKLFPVRDEYAYGVNCLARDAVPYSHVVQFIEMYGGVDGEKFPSDFLERITWFNGEYVKIGDLDWPNKPN